MAEHSGPVRGSGDVAMEMRAEMQRREGGSRVWAAQITDHRQGGGQASEALRRRLWPSPAWGTRKEKGEGVTPVSERGRTDGWQRGGGPIASPL